MKEQPEIKMFYLKKRVEHDETFLDLLLVEDLLQNKKAEGLDFQILGVALGHNEFEELGKRFLLQKFLSIIEGC